MHIRMFAPRTFCIVALLIAAMPCRASGSERWTEQEAWQWYNHQPWIVGANWVPAYAVNTVEMWQADPNTPGADTFDMAQIEFELDHARDTGFNSLRVFLSYEVWKGAHDGFMSRVEQFVSAAADRDIRPMFVFWDDVRRNLTLPYLGAQPNPTHGVIGEFWYGSGREPVLDNPGNWELSHTSPLPGAGAKQYIQDIVGTYANDPRVLMWDLYNEPGFWPSHEPEPPNNGIKQSALLTASADWAREVNPMQPLATSIFYDLGTSLQTSDLANLHSYGSEPFRSNDLGGRPLLVTEWMARSFGSTVDSLLPYFYEHQVGIHNWGVVTGDMQAKWPWGGLPQPPGAEPDPWHHDLYERDGTPYRQEEIALFQHYSLLDKVIRSADSEYVQLANPSFETPDLGGVPGALLHMQFDGWTITHSSGGWVGGTMVPATGQFNEAVPDGTQAVFALDLEIAQQLSERLEAGTYYVLTASVGNAIGKSWPGFDLKLLAGGTDLTPISESQPEPFDGDWLTASKIFLVEAGDPLIGETLGVHLRSLGAETFFDNVQLMAVSSILSPGIQSDLNLDGVIDAADWIIFRDNNLTAFTGLTSGAAYVRGDLDRDLDSDVDDFRLFKSDYENAHGIGSFAAMLVGVPEPTSLMLFGIWAVLSWMRMCAPRARFLPYKRWTSRWTEARGDDEN